MLDIKAIKARCEAATDGVWCLESEGVLTEAPEGCDCDYPTTAGCPPMVRVFDDRSLGTQQAMDNLEFAANARQDIPDLIEEVERLKAELRDLKMEVKGVRARADRFEAELDRVKTELEEGQEVWKKIVQGVENKAIRWEDRARRYREGLENLVNKLDRVHEHYKYKAAWDCAHMHQGPYTGPLYKEELDAARQSLQPQQVGMKEPEGLCDACGKDFRGASGAWRFNGQRWEHRCDDVHPQCGHIGTLIPAEKMRQQSAEGKDCANCEHVLIAGESPDGCAHPRYAKVLKEFAAEYFTCPEWTHQDVCEECMGTGVVPAGTYPIKGGGVHQATRPCPKCNPVAKERNVCSECGGSGVDPKDEPPEDMEGWIPRDCPKCKPQGEE